MNVSLLPSITTCLIGLALVVPPAPAQGPLAPPGAPAPTMKTLEQVEPRTPISSLPFTITNGGSFYLASSLTSSGDGVVIQSDDVTLDLNGYSLSGTLTSQAQEGVLVDGGTNLVRRNVVVKNGTIIGFGNSVELRYASFCRLERLTCIGAGVSGIYINASSGQANGNAIFGCTISDPGGIGVLVYANRGESCGNSISHTLIMGADLYGIQLNGALGQCNGNRITECSVLNAGDYGMYFIGASGQCSGNFISSCSIIDSGGRGIWLNGNSGSCDGNTVSKCQVLSPGVYGIHLTGDSNGQCTGNAIIGNTIRTATQRGISLSAADGNRVESNHSSGTVGRGIVSTSTTDNMILKNTSVGHPFSNFLDADDTYGPEVTDSGALSDTGVASHPWANFYR